MLTYEKEERLRKRHKRVRKRILGTPERPRLSVHRSHKNLQAQLIDDIAGRTVFGFSTQSKEVRKKISQVSGVESARILGEAYAPMLKEKGFEKIVFDRGGYRYHGRIKALAESLRQGGIQF